MQFFKQKNGAVSIFLVIILVPCMFMSSLFVDIGRVHLSKGMANSSADLALNTVLTKYDYNLKDFYGLAASCQSIDEFYSVSTDYFENTMASQGLTEEEIDLLSAEFVNAITNFADQEVSDFLDVEIENVDITSAVPDVKNGSNMANPTLIKDGIIEFMKYRAPLGIAERGVLKLLGERQKELEQVENDQNLQKAKENYYQKEKDFYAQAKQTYDLIVDYNELKITETVLNSYIKSINTYDEKYKAIHSALVHDLVNTDSLLSLVICEYDHNDKTDTYDVDKYYEKYDPITNELVSFNYATEADIRALIYDLLDSIKVFNAKKQALMDSFIKEYSNGIGATDTYDLQYWVKSMLAITVPYGEFEITSKKSLMYSYNALVDALEYPDEAAKAVLEDANSTKWEISSSLYSEYDKKDEKLTTQQHCDAVKAQYNSLYDTYINTVQRNEGINGDDYIKYMSILDRITQDGKLIEKADETKNILVDYNKSVEALIDEISGEVTAMKLLLGKGVEQLGYIETALIDLEADRSSRVDALEGDSGWEKFAKEQEQNESEMGKTDMTEIKDGVTDSETGKKQTPVKEQVKEVTSKDITELKDRITEMKQLQNDLIDFISGQKYGDTSIAAISSTVQAIVASGISRDELDKEDYLTNKSLKDYADSKFTFVKYSNSDASVGYDGEEAKVTYTENNHPEITHSPVPSLYTWLDDRDWSNNGDATRKCNECQEMFDPSVYDDVIAKQKEADSKMEIVDGEGQKQKPEDSLTVDVYKCPACLYGYDPDSDEDKESGLEKDAKNREENYDPGDSGVKTGDIKDKTEEKDEPWNKDDFPSSIDGANKISLFTSIGGIVELVQTLAGGFGEGAELFRDSLYTTEYIFGMFSHATYEKEAKYQILLNYGKSELGITSETTIEQLRDVTKISADKVNERFNSEDPEVRYNKSLTNKKICAENNFAYGAEIEYILRGGSNSDNIKDIYANIYLTRFATNSIAGFMTFWNTPKPEKDATNGPELQTKAALYKAVSAAVNAATYGIVPAALVKTVLILIEVGIETALDMQYLKAGIPVKFIKGKCDENWGFTRKVDIETETKGTGDKATTVYKVASGYINYSDYLYVITLSALMETNVLDSVYRRIGDVIQSNMRVITKYEDYKLSNAITHFKFSATLKVNPLMINIPLFSEFGNKLTNDEWRTYTVDVIRGY